MNELEKVKLICEKLQSTSGKKDKEQILRDNQDNQLFKDALYFILNPYIISGLSTKKINKKIGIIPNINYLAALTLGYDSMDIRNLFEYIKQNNTGRDLDISICKSYINNFDVEIQEFIKSIITKSLKLGIDKTANKVYGKGFIPSFECMLANKYFEMPQKVEGKDFTLTTKLDGIRCILIKKDNKVSLFSRQGQLIEGLVDIENDALQISTNYVLDGELLISDTDNIPSKDQYKATTKIVRKDGEKHGITYRVFDTLTVEEFETQTCTHIYTERRKALDYVKSFNLEHIQVLPVLYQGNDIEQISNCLAKARADNQEGIMINLNDAMYDFKRTSNLLKCKVMQDADLLITNTYEGTGRNIGKLGGIGIEFIHEGNYYRCNCGSGFSDEERVLYYNRPELLLGKVATIQFFEISQDSKGNYGLRFPVWTSRIRDDKTEISMN